MKIEVTQEQKQPGKKERKNKVINLTVHKNTIDKKLKAERKQIFKEYFKAVQENVPSPSGFAIIAWDDELKSVTFTIDNIEDIELFPEKIKILLTREINKYLDQVEAGVEEEE